MNGPTCQACDQAYPDEAVHESCANVRIYAEGDPDSGGGWPPTKVADLRPKPFCPCDLGQPQHCQPERWGEAHKERICLVCSRASYTHRTRPQDGVILCSPVPLDLDAADG